MHLLQGLLRRGQLKELRLVVRDNRPKGKTIAFADFDQKIDDQVQLGVVRALLSLENLFFFQSAYKWPSICFTRRFQSFDRRCQDRRNEYFSQPDRLSIDACRSRGSSSRIGYTEGSSSGMFESNTGPSTQLGDKALD